MKVRVVLVAALGAFAGGAVALSACDDDGTIPHPGVDSGTSYPDGGGVPDARVDSGTDAGADADAPRKCPPSVPASGAAFGDWDTRLTLAGLTGRDGATPAVHDMARDVDGSLLVAGYFRWAGNLRVDGLARWRNGAWEPGRTDWNGRDLGSGGFYAVAVGPKGELALAANVGQAGDPDEIWVDRGKGLEVVGRYLGLAHRLVWIDGKLWVGGGVQFENGGPKGLAIWDGTTWSGAVGGDPDSYVFDIVPDENGHVLVSGEFHKMGGIASDLIADWDGHAWSAKYRMAKPELRVITLARDAKGTLYAGGVFTLGEANKGSASLAKWNGTQWELVGNGVAFTYGTGVVGHILPQDDAIYVAGCFDHVNGAQSSPDRIAAAGMAKWDGTQWTSLDDGSKPVSNGWFSSGACGFEPSPKSIWDMPRQRMAMAGTSLVVGGAFAGAGGVPSQSIAIHDGRAWKAAGTAGQGISGKITALASAPDSCDVYGLAAASHAGGAALISPLVRYDASGWKSAAPPLPDKTVCSRIAAGKDGAIALACENRAAKELPGRVLLLKDGAWTSLVPEELPRIHDLGYAPDGTLWLGGAGANKDAFLAHVEGGKLVKVGNDAFDGAVYRIAFAPHANDPGYDTVVGGFFTKIGALAADRIARWDGTAWSALGEGAGGMVSAIAATKDAVYVATQNQKQPNRKLLARWDGKTWTELATPANGVPAPMGQTVHTFTALLPLDAGRIVAVGRIWPAAGGRNAYYFDGTKFSSISGGVSAIGVDAVALGANALYLGGSIAEVGDGNTLRPSVGVARIPLAAKAP